MRSCPRSRVRSRDTVFARARAHFSLSLSLSAALALSLERRERAFVRESGDSLCQKKEAFSSLCLSLCAEEAERSAAVARRTRTIDESESWGSFRENWEMGLRQLVFPKWRTSSAAVSAAWNTFFTSCRSPSPCLEFLRREGNLHELENDLLVLYSSVRNVVAILYPVSRQIKKNRLTSGQF